MYTALDLGQKIIGVDLTGPFVCSREAVKGAVGKDIEKKEFVVFTCKSLILAAGGCTRVYAVSSSRIFENYGEGITIAYEVGADLVDMEMAQFHPTGMVWPEKAVGTLAHRSNTR